MDIFTSTKKRHWTDILVMLYKQNLFFNTDAPMAALSPNWHISTNEPPSSRVISILMCTSVPSLKYIGLSILNFKVAQGVWDRHTERYVQSNILSFELDIITFR